MDAMNFFFESSTMGTILVLVVYFLANLALPFYYRKYRPPEFTCSSTSCCRCSAWSRSPCRSTTCVKPGQPQPYNWFPYAALAIVVRRGRSTATG